MRSLYQLVETSPVFRRPVPRHRLVVCLLVAGTALTSASCKSDYPAAAQQSPSSGRNDPARAVKTAQVEEYPLAISVVVMGSLAAYDQATLSVKVPGRLGSISVDLGSVVQKGQIVAQIEPRDYELRLKQAEAALAQARARLGLPPDGNNDTVDAEKTGTIRQARALLEEARANLERVKQLLRQGVVSQSQMDSADSSYKVAESRYQDAFEEIRNRQALLVQRRSELDLARQQLTDTSIVAPFDGVVQERRSSVGEYLPASAPVVTIVKINPLRLRAEVPERESQKIRLDQTVHVTVEGDPSAYSGHITRLSPTIGTQNRTLLVEADVINNGRLRPGAFVKAEIVTDQAAKSLTVPSNAIVTFAGIEKVIVVEQNKAVEKQVTTGRRAGDRVEILSGIKSGEAVVVEPGNLQTGQAVAEKQS